MKIWLASYLIFNFNDFRVFNVLIFVFNPKCNVKKLKL